MASLLLAYTLSSAYILPGTSTTTSAVDNIDHVPISTSAHTSFHGTGISLVQHQDVHHISAERACVPHTKANCKSSKLPNDYTTVPAVLTIKDPAISEINELKKPNSVIDLVANTQKCQHFCNASVIQNNPNEESNEKNRMHVSWATYHANHQSENNSQTAISTLLPLFSNDSKSVAMIKHSMGITMKAVNILNQAQTLITAYDQHSYKIAKDIQ